MLKTIIFELLRVVPSIISLFKKEKKTETQEPIQEPIQEHPEPLFFPIYHALQILEAGVRVTSSSIVFRLKNGLVYRDFIRPGILRPISKQEFLETYNTHIFSLHK